MSNTVISVESLSKVYRLGQIGTGTLSRDINVWWAKVRGKPNPILKIGEEDYGNRDGGTIWALKDVNFTVDHGEVLGIIGRNGAGKSTLLKILSQVTAPTSGHVRVKGQIASLLEVGTGFHPDLTGRENTYLNGAILGMTRKEVRRKLGEIVAFAEIEQFIDTPVKRYSSGMYVRLAFAVAAHLESEILLVDEVLAVGDAEFQKKCLGKMEDVAKRGKTVLFVSHNLGMIQQLCTRCIIINKGLLFFDGSPKRTIDEYLSTDIVEENVVEYKPGLTGVDTRAKLNKVELLDTKGNPSTFFEIDKGFKVRVLYYLENNFRNFSIALRFFSATGELVFISGDLDDKMEDIVKGPGYFESICQVPGNFLNTGTYFLSISAHIPHIQSFFAVDYILKIPYIPIKLYRPRTCYTHGVGSTNFKLDK